MWFRVVIEGEPAGDVSPQEGHFLDIGDQRGVDDPLGGLALLSTCSLLLLLVLSELNLN
jgi:hypothetical protein